MKINFNQPLRDLDDNIIEISSEDEQPYTLSECVVRALTYAHKDDVELKAEDKIKRVELAHAIVKNPVQDLTAEQIAEVKKLVNRINAPLIVYRAFEILDPKVKEVESEAS